MTKTDKAAASKISSTSRPAGEPHILFHEWQAGRIALVEPADVTKAQVVVVHGLSEHAGRPLPFARHLARGGYRTIVVELAGHGAPAHLRQEMSWIYEAYAKERSAAETLEIVQRESERSRTELRRLVEQQYASLKKTDARQHLGQIAAAVELARHLDPALPIFLIGHSMGGLLSLEAIWRWSEQPRADLRGLVLLSPALRPTPPEGKPLEKLLFETVWTLRSVPISLTRSAAKTLLSLNLPLDTTSGNRWLSDQSEEIALYASDPLVPHKIPTRYLNSIESLMAQVDRRGVLLPVPGLVIVPERDGITSAEAGAGFARSVQRAMTGERMQLEQIENICAHDLLRSSARCRALESVLGWLDRAVSSGEGSSAPRAA